MVIGKEQRKTKFNISRVCSHLWKLRSNKTIQFFTISNREEQSNEVITMLTERQKFYIKCYDFFSLKTNKGDEI